MPIIKLKHPVVVNDLHVAEITIPDRLKTKHLRALDQADGEIGKMTALIAALAEMPRSVIDELDAEDFTQLCEVAGGFLDGFPATGKT